MERAKKRKTAPTNAEFRAAATSLLIGKRRNVAPIEPTKPISTIISEDVGELYGPDAREALLDAMRAMKEMEQ